MSVNGLKGLTYLTHRTILEHQTELMGGIDHTTDELRCQFIADENPLRQAETLRHYQQLVLVGKIKQGIVQKHDSIFVFLQQLCEP